MSEQKGRGAGGKLVTGADYIDSLRGRNLNVYLFGERIAEPVDHPMIRPSINAVAETYDLAVQHPELGTAVSHLTGQPVNRFLHVAHSVADVVNQNKMQRLAGIDLSEAVREGLTELVDSYFGRVFETAVATPATAE